MRRIIIECDLCRQHGRETLGRITDIAVRRTDPSMPGEDANSPLIGSLELCDSCAKPVEELASLLQRYGKPLGEEDAHRLVAAPPQKQEEADAYVCHTCDPPSNPLKKGSLYTHARNQHRMSHKNLKLRPVKFS